MAELPPSLADALQPALPTLVEDIIEAIGREVPDYRRPLEGEFGRGLRFGVDRALARFVQAVGGAGQVDPPGDIYVELGRGEHRAGRDLDALLSAYRLGARLAWERFSRAAFDAGHEPETLIALATAIFSYIDAISAQSAGGYAEEQSRLAGERERRRRALARLLGRSDVTPGEIADVAAAAGWPLPRTVAVLAVAAPGRPAGDVGAPPAGPRPAERGLARLGDDVLLSRRDETLVAFVPDPDGPGRHDALAAAVGDAQAALGPTVAPERAAHSLARAEALLRLDLPPGLRAADDHLLALLLGSDAALAAEQAKAALSPLDGLGAAPRVKLETTLRAWLDDPGHVSRVAAVLGVHPQTVRYRVGQLRDAFGADLEQPEPRFALQVALRARLS